MNIIKLEIAFLIHPPVSKASREVANLTERKNLHTLLTKTIFLNDKSLMLKRNKYYLLTYLQTKSSTAKHHQLRTTGGYEICHINFTST